MKAIHKGKIVDVWEIQTDNHQPDWVQEGFAKNYLVWMDNHLRILMAGLHASWSKNLSFGITGSIGGGFAGYGIYVLGYPGDFLDITNHQVVSAKRFAKEYQILDE